ncbi:MAG: sulfatase-like hydrolase/transferase, partial [Pseudomonadota bacterium]
PEETKLAPRPDDIQPWSELTDVERRVFSRQAEVFAGFVDHTDANIGRLIDAVEALGILNNTFIVFIAGDNGTSAEGTMAGLFNEMTYFNNYAENVEDLVPLLDKWGSDKTYPHMAAGWAVAFDTPFTWTKQVASDFGGTRNGMVIHWPDGIEAKGELRTQFSHVVDIVPTILEAAKLPIPSSVNGVPQQPMDGESLVYSFDSPDAEERHTTQYFEMFGNRAIYHEGWYARTIHKLPWGSTLASLEEDSWSLYNTEEDFSLALDLAEQEPERLADLQALFMNEAEENHVLPIDDRVVERLNPDIAGRPDLMAGRTTLSLPGTAPPLLENTFINVKNRSKEVIAEISVSTKDASGVIITQGGSFGGWSLYVRDGKPEYTYNYLGVERYTLSSERELPPGDSTIRLVFDYDGGGVGKGGDVQLLLNDEIVATGRVERTQPIIFSADETADIGRDFQSPVAEGIGEGSNETAFTGRIKRVTISASETN